MKTWAAGLALALALASNAWAQPPRFTGADIGGPPAGTSSELVPDVLEKVGIDQKLNAQVPLDAVFRAEDGREVRLGDYFGKRPVVLSLVYYECPMLCTQVLNGAVAAFKVLNFNIGDDFDVVTLSFDPRETPAMASAKKETYLDKYGRPEGAKGWHFLTGDQAAIDALTSSVGFRYAFDQESQQYVHASALMVLTPDGRVSQVLLRDRLSAARPAARPHRGVGRKDRHPGRSGPALLLSLRSALREVQLGGDERPPAGGGRHGGPDWRVHRDDVGP